MNYYVSSSQGNDKNLGTIEMPWKTLKRASRHQYIPGDKLLLKSNDVWNETLLIKKTCGTQIEPIVIGAYGKGDKPAILRNGKVGEKCIVLKDSAGWKIDGLRIGNSGGLGILFHYDETYEHEYLSVENCYFHDIVGINQENRAEGEAYQFSAAIGIGGNASKNKTSSYFIKNIYIKNNVVRYCGSLLVTVGGARTGFSCYKQNMYIEDCLCEYNAIYGLVVSETQGGWVKNCKCLFNGTQSMKYGSTGIMLGNLFDYQILDTEIAYQKRIGVDPDGCGIDFEVNCSNVTVKNCLIHHNAGVGIMFFGQGGNINKKCVIESCMLYQNNLNPFVPSGYEVFFSEKDRNMNGTVKNNIYYETTGIKFINDYDSSVTVENNFKRPSLFEKENKDIYHSSRDFSLNQGRNQWTYNAFKQGKLVPLKWDIKKARYYAEDLSCSNEYYDPDFPGCFVAARYQHPQKYDSVRSWQAPENGKILITAAGNIKLANDGGDGVLVSVMHNENILWGPKLILTSQGECFPTLTLSIQESDNIHFVVNKNEDFKNDLTFWDPIIIYTEKNREELYI